MWSKLMTLGTYGLTTVARRALHIAHASIFYNRGRYLFTRVVDPEPDMFLGLLDPDPLVKGGSVSFYHQAKIARKNLDSYCFG
jgi:hypothetical protein